MSCAFHYAEYYTHSSEMLQNDSIHTVRAHIEKKTGGFTAMAT